MPKQEISWWWRLAGGVVYDRHHNYQVAFYTAAALAALALLCEFGAKRPAPARELVGCAKAGL